MKRRDALRMLAAAGAATSGALIISQPARADTGTETCRYDFSGGGPVATFSAFNTIFGDFFGIDMTVGGTCPCGSVSSIEYAYFLDATNDDFSTGSGWVPGSAWNVNFASLWPGGGGAFTVTAGVRVTCTGPAGDTIRCRYATSASISIGGGFFSSVTGQTLTLGTNNGDSGSGVLPVCNPPAAAAPFAAGRLFSNSAAAGGALMMQPGPLVLPDEVLRLEAGELPDDPLGNPLDPVDPDATRSVESPVGDDAPSATTTSSTTTSTTPESSTSTTTTSTTAPAGTTSTTSTPSTTSTTSTTTPSAGATPPPAPTGP